MHILSAIKFFVRYLKIMIVVVGFLLPVTVMAQAVSNLEVKGNERVEIETIQSYLGFDGITPLTEDMVSEGVKRLYATGLFSDIRSELHGNHLVLMVKENPTINELVFEGNKRLDDESLAAEIILKPRAVFSRTEAEHDTKRIIELYHKSGRYAVKVVPKLIELPQNRVNVVFEIEEGPKTYIKRINFIGNKAFPDDKLVRAVQTKQHRWYRFFAGDDTYDEDRLAFDRELLRKYYVSHGYPDFKVTSTVVELTPERDGFFITFTIEEGDLYKFGDITVTSSLENVKTDGLKHVIETKKGHTYNAEEVDRTMDKMSELLSNQGYAFIEIDPGLARNDQTKRVNLAYNIREGSKAYVGKINIHGNVRTLDEVVRREFRLHEGDPFNAAKIRRSRERLQNLGFFEKIDIDHERDEQYPDRINLDVNVAEQSTGELNFGVGVSTTEGALANVAIRERNLLGRGQDLKVSLMAAQKSIEADLGFTEPYFMDKEIAAGFDIFNIIRDQRSESSFDSKTTGGTLRASYAITEYLKHSVRYSFKKDDIQNVAADASRFIKDQEGTNSTSLVGHSFIYDRRDDRFNPASGYYLRFNQDIAGIGGDASFFRNELIGSYFHQMFRKDVVLSLSGKAGHVVGLGGKDVRINERFFIGAKDIRGFKNAGIGPRDINTRDALGGNTYYTSSAELTFPLGFAKEMGFLGAVFVDAASLYDIDANGPEIADSDSMRVSVGAGLSWKSPVGPLRIDFGFPIQKEKFDREQQVRFNFGSRF